MRIIKAYKNSPTPIKATFWFTLCAFLQKAFSMVTVPIFTRLMTTEQYGEFSVFNSVFGVLVIIATMKVDAVLATRGLSKFKERQNLYISNIQCISTVCAFFTLGIYIIFRKSINAAVELNTMEMLGMMGLIFVTPAFDIWSAKKRYEYSYKSIALLTIVYLLVNTIVSIIAVVTATNKGEARIMAHCLVSFVIYGFLFFKNMRFFRYDSPMVKYAVMFNLPLIPQGLANHILNKSDVFMIQHYLGQSQAGVYSLGYSIAMIVVILTTSVNNAFVPWLYKKLDNMELKRTKEVFNCMVMIVYSGVIGVMLIAPEVVKLFAPPSYSDAVYIVAPAVAGIAFMFIYTFFVQIEMYYEKTVAIMLGSFCVAFLNILLNALFIPKYGSVAAAYTTLVSYGCYAVVHFFLAYKLCKERVRITEIYDIKRLIELSVILIFMVIVSPAIYPILLIRVFLLAMIIVFGGVMIKQYIGIIKT